MPLPPEKRNGPGGDRAESVRLDEAPGSGFVTSTVDRGADEHAPRHEDQLVGRHEDPLVGRPRCPVVHVYREALRWLTREPSHRIIVCCRAYWGDEVAS
jgi:hypothetical protein